MPYPVLISLRPPRNLHLRTHLILAQVLRRDIARRRKPQARLRAFRRALADGAHDRIDDLAEHAVRLDDRVLDVGVDRAWVAGRHKDLGTAELALDELAGKVDLSQLRAAVPGIQCVGLGRDEDCGDGMAYKTVGSRFSLISSSEANLTSEGAIRCSSDDCITMRTLAGGADWAVLSMSGRRRSVSTKCERSLTCPSPMSTECSQKGKK